MITLPRCRMPCQWMLTGSVTFRLFFTLHITAVVVAPRLSLGSCLAAECAAVG
jgi:hypothetical protein